MANISDVLTKSWGEWALSLFVLLFAVREVINLVGFFREKSGYETPTQKALAEIKKDMEYFKSRLNKFDEVDESQSSILKALGREALATHYLAAEKNGFITADESREWEDLYVAYKALGGNGTADHLKHLKDQLPIK